MTGSLHLRVKGDDMAEKHEPPRDQDYCRCTTPILSSDVGAADDEDDFCWGCGLPLLEDDE
jgi:hypothetical protein